MTREAGAALSRVRIAAAGTVLLPDRAVTASQFALGLQATSALSTGRRRQLLITATANNPPGVGDAAQCPAINHRALLVMADDCSVCASRAAHVNHFVADQRLYGGAAVGRAHPGRQTSVRIV